MSKFISFKAQILEEISQWLSQGLSLSDFRIHLQSQGFTQSETSEIETIFHQHQSQTN